MVLKAFPRPQELYLGAVVGVVPGLLRMSAAVGLVGRGCRGTSPECLCMCCYFRLTAGETGGPRGVCWARERGPRGGALGHGAVLVMAAREPVAISEVVTWRYRSMCTAASYAPGLIWPTLPMSLPSPQACTRDNDKPKAKNWSERLRAVLLQVRGIVATHGAVTLRFSSVTRTHPPRKGGNKRPLSILRPQPPTQHNATQHRRPGTLLSSCW